MTTVSRRFPVGSIDGVTAAMIGGACSLLLAFVTAFFALRKTVVEATAEENRTFFSELGDRLSEVEANLRLEQEETAKLRGEVVELREKLSAARIKISELELRNEKLAAERESFLEEREELHREIDELETRINDLEAFSEAVTDEIP